MTVKIGLLFPMNFGMLGVTRGIINFSIQELDFKLYLQLS